MEGFLQVVKSKTGARLRISITLGRIGLSLVEVIRRCRDRVVAKQLAHHHRTVARVKAGATIMPDTISKEFAAARDRAVAKLGLVLGNSPPPFHEQGALAARFPEQEGRDAQRRLGHHIAKMTDMYLDSRGSAGIDFAWFCILVLGIYWGKISGGQSISFKFSTLSQLLYLVQIHCNTKRRRQVRKGSVHCAQPF